MPAAGCAPCRCRPRWSRRRGLTAEGYREIVINGIEISSWGWEWKDGSCLRQLLAALCAAVPGGPDPPGLAGAAHHRRGLLQDALRLPQSLPAVPPESAVRLGYRPAADAPPVRYRAVSRKRPAAAAVFPRLRRHDRPHCRFPRRNGGGIRPVAGLLRTCGLSMFHIFPYSRRKGRPPPPCPTRSRTPSRRRRAAEAAAVAAELETQYHTALLGTTQQVLFEQEEDGLYAGHAMNYVKVYVRAADLHNEIRAVRITELCRDGGLWRIRITGMAQLPRRRMDTAHRRPERPPAARCRASRRNTAGRSARGSCAAPGSPRRHSSG